MALIIVLGFIVYGNSLNGKFIWDDEALVENNIYIRNWSNIEKIFTKDIGAGAGEEFGFYRPLQMLTYMVDYSFWNLNVKGYHLTNVLLHILSALAIFWLINLFYDDWLCSLLTSLFFVVHPIHTEAVTYISGRADSLAALFILLSFIFYIKYLHTKKVFFYILVFLSYTLALLSRENSLILPLVLLLYHYSFKQRLRAKQFVPILTLALIYIIVRFTLLSFLSSDITYSTTLFQRLPGFFVAITGYLRLMILPFNLHMEYGKKLFNLTHPQAILGILILISLFIYIVGQRKTKGLIFFSLSWFLITLLPSSNLYPINAYMAEHWLYLPSIGFFLILAKSLSFLHKNKRFKILGIAITLFLLIFYSCLTIKQNDYWQEPITFYKKTLKYAPDSSKTYNNLGVIYDDIGKKKEAIASYKKAIQTNSNYSDAYYNLGNTYSTLNKTEEAIAVYTKAIQLNPDLAEAYNSLAYIYYNNGEKIEAIVLYKKAISIDPDYSQAYDNLAVVYFREKKYNLAIKYCTKAKELGYNNPALLKALKPYREREE